MSYYTLGEHLHARMCASSVKVENSTGNIKVEHPAPAEPKAAVKPLVPTKTLKDASSALFCQVRLQLEHVIVKRLFVCGASRCI